MKIFDLTVDEEKAGKRIDAYLSESKEIPSRAFAQKLLKAGSVEVNGNKVNKSFKLNAGDKVGFTLAEPEKIDVEPQDLPLNILYEDDDLAVVEKPAGMVTHPSYGHWKGTLVNALLFRLKGLSSIGGVMRPGIIHRLDKDTSGLLIVAKNDESHLKLSRQLKDRKVKRRYMALVHGHMEEATGKIDMPIGRSYKDRKKMAVIPDGRPSVTEYAVAERHSGCDLLSTLIYPEIGQVRGAKEIKNTSPYRCWDE